MDLGCSRAGCVSLGDEKAGYRFVTDGEMLLEAVDGFGRDPLFLEAAAAGRGIAPVGSHWSAGK
jgi:hypothetical protein